MIRDRIKSIRRVAASDLIPHPKNPAMHPDAQKSAMRAVLEDVGYVGGLIGWEHPDGIQILDGHLRADTTPDQKVPVQILDVKDQAEADKIVMFFDPIGRMAERDTDATAELLKSVETESDVLQAMIDGIAKDAGLLVEPEIVEDEPPIDCAAELQEKWGTERTRTLGL